MTGSLLFHGKTVRRMIPLVERLVHVSRLPRRWLRPPGKGRTQIHEPQMDADERR